MHHDGDDMLISSALRTSGAALLVVAPFALMACPRPPASQDRSDGDSIVLVPPDDADRGGGDDGGRGEGPSTDAAVSSPEAGTDGAPVGGDDAVPPSVLRQWPLADGMVKRGSAWRLDRQAHEALRQEDFAEAERLWTEAIAMDSSFERAYGELGVVHLRAKNHQRCVEVSQRCVRSVLDPGRLGACYWNLGNCLDHLGRHEDALRAYERSVDLRQNDIAERALAKAARRLRQQRATTDRERRSALVDSAARAFLERSCDVRITAEQSGVLACGKMAVWGAAGPFVSRDMSEVLLVLRDERISRDDRSGYGVLLRRREDGEWAQLSKTRLLAPGEGGVDFLARVPVGGGGTVAPVVQVSDCRDGCCSGAVSVLRFDVRGEGVLVRAERLLATGSSRELPGAPGRKALVTGARLMSPSRDDAVELLLRYETRLGKQNPVVRYLRYQTAGEAFALRGPPPSTDAVPRCEAPRQAPRPGQG